MKKGRPYYYAVESARVNGKPRIVWQKYLGTVDGIVERMERTRPERTRKAVLFEAGGAAALLRIAQRLDLMGLIDAAGTQADTQQTIATYRSLTQIEEVFKNMKNVDFLRWQPAYRWTEQKLKVHGFYCVLAFLLATLARKLACQAGLELTLPALLEELTAIREVAVIYPQGTLAHPKDHITLSRMSSTQRKLADALDIATALKG